MDDLLPIMGYMRMMVIRKGNSTPTMFLILMSRWGTPPTGFPLSTCKRAIKRKRNARDYGNRDRAIILCGGQVLTMFTCDVHVSVCTTYTYVHIHIHPQVTLAGKILPPLIGIRASKTSKIQKGHPLVIEVKDPEYTSLFDSGDKVPPLVVIYSDKDKKNCGEIYNELILNPLCELRKSSGSLRWVYVHRA